jgi:outer membrane protein assembly factor BamE (lipoprotein component of BamABCDE complex)
MTKKVIKTILLILLIAVSISGILVFPKLFSLYKEEKIARELLEECQNIQVGMTRAEVVAIMGEPSRVLRYEHRGSIGETLLFPSPLIAAMQTSCVIDKKRGVVVEVRCGEGYRRTEPEMKCEKLEVGMTRDQVIQIMGEPDYMDEFYDVSGINKEEWLYYVSRQHPAIVVRCVINKNSGKLKITYCD